MQHRTETKVEQFGLSLWSQRKTDSKSEVTQCVSLKHVAVYVNIQTVHSNVPGGDLKGLWSIIRIYSTDDQLDELWLFLVTRQHNYFCQLHSVEFYWQITWLIDWLIDVPSSKEKKTFKISVVWCEASLMLLISMWWGSISISGVKLGVWIQYFFHLWPAVFPSVNFFHIISAVASRGFVR